MIANWTPKLFDAHCHVNFGLYGDDTEAIIGRAKDKGIGLIAVGTRYETSLLAATCSNMHETVWAIVGMHPSHLYPEHDASEDCSGTPEIFNPARYRILAQENERVIGIGECGLDYYHRPEGVSLAELKTRQDELFRAHLDLALELDVPVMVHTRDGREPAERAHPDVLAILAEYAAAGRPLRGNIHCWSGTWEDAHKYLKLGFHLSFTGNLTYPPRAAEKKSGETLAAVAKRVPLERILVETDAPYLAPVPHRGKRNEPAYVELVARALAAIKGISYEEVAAQTTKNVKGLFGI